MANIKAAQTGNWNATSTWIGGVVPVSGDNVSSNNFTVTIDVNATVANVTNGTTYSATAGGGFVLNNGITLTATCTCGGVNGLILISGTASASIVGNIASSPSSGGVGVTMSSSGTLTINGNISAGNGVSAFGVVNTAGGTINITNATCTGAAGGGVPAAVQNSAGGTIIMTTATVNGSNGVAVNNALSGIISITGNVTAGALAAGATNSSTGTFTIIGDITASNGASGFTSFNASATNRLSGSFISSANGTAAIYAQKYVLWSTPLNAKTRYALNGTSTYVDMFTADNNLGQASPADVRFGTTYASGANVGTLRVPSPSSVALGVLTDATTGTAILTAAAIRTELAVELARIDANVSSRLAPSDTLATVTTLTNAPTVPTASAIASQVRTELSVELARVDAAVSTRLASSAYTALSNSDVTAIKAKTDLLNTDRLAQCATTSIVGSLIAQSNS